MRIFTALLSSFFVYLIGACYKISHNYILSVAIFTFLTKLIIFPLSLWTHWNSLKMVSLMPDLNHLKVAYYGDKDAIAEKTQELYKEKGYSPLLSLFPMIVQILLLMGVTEAIRELLGNSKSALTLIPVQAGGLTLLIPIAAAVAAAVLGIAQNHFNPLQREQNQTEQFATNIISVGISLILGMFVPLGTGVYWIASTLFTIPNQLILNAVAPPQKCIDYPSLEKSKQELKEIENLGTKVSKEDKLREKADYKRFFSVTNKHLVFYSEKSGFYKYYEDLIDELLKRSNLTIHYITSDPKDQVFQLSEKQPRIHPYYIGEKKLITLMMKMDADIVVMTTPDLENFHIKRSYVRKDIEYIFVNHGLGSINTEYRTGALDHFDTVFMNNQQDEKEIRAWEKLKNLPEKRLVEYGYPLLDHLQKEYEASSVTETKNNIPKIVIAPSWQQDNIMESCIEKLLDGLLRKGYQIVVRPHPQYIKHHAVDIKRLEEKYFQYQDELSFETDFSSFSNIYNADLVVTDWSGVGYEFSFTTCRPVLFIHTPMKIMNPEYKKIGIESFAERMRNKVGKDLPLEDIGKIKHVVEELLASEDQYKAVIEKSRTEERYHVGCAAETGARYIVSRLTR